MLSRMTRAERLVFYAALAFLAISLCVIAYVLGQSLETLHMLDEARRLAGEARP